MEREGRDFWTDEPVRLSRGRLVSELAPHACRLVEFGG
jgi:hypothetical protein